MPVMAKGIAFCIICVRKYIFWLQNSRLIVYNFRVMQKQRLHIVPESAICQTVTNLIDGGLKSSAHVRFKSTYYVQ